MWVGIAVLATNALAGIRGAVSWLRGLPSPSFWWMLRAAQVAVAIQVALGLILVARGASAPDGLHIAYGISPLVVTLVSEGMRVGAAHRELEDVEDIEALTRDEQIAIARRVALSEMGVMTVGALLILTLALRAYQTGG
jgi:multisubunit Na+/H+ antiporter MnhF subunit